MQGGGSWGRGLERGGGRNLRRPGSDHTEVVVRIRLVGVGEHALDLLLAVVQSAKLDRRGQRLDVRFVLDALGVEVLRFASPVGERFGCVRAPSRVLPGPGWARTSVQTCRTWAQEMKTHQSRHRAFKGVVMRNLPLENSKVALQGLDLMVLRELARRQRCLRRLPLVDVHAIMLRKGRRRVAERRARKAATTVTAPDAGPFDSVVCQVERRRVCDAIPAVLHVGNAAGERFAGKAGRPVVARRDPLGDEIGRPRLKEVAASVWQREDETVRPAPTVARRREGGSQRVDERE